MQNRRASSRSRTESLARWSIWLAVLSSVVFLPGALNRWVLPKDTVLAIACVLAAVLAARLSPSGRLPRWLWAVVGAAVLVLLVATVQSAAPIAQLVGRWPRFEGAVTLPVYFGALWLGASVLGARRTGERSASLLSAVTCAALLLGAVSLLEAVGVQLIPTDASRPGALLGNATDQGILAAMFFALLLVPLVRSWLAPDLGPHASAPGRNAGGGPQQRQGQKQRASARTPPQNSPPSRTPARPWWPLAGATAALLTVVVSASRAAFLAVVVVVLGSALLELLRRRMLVSRLRLTVDETSDGESARDAATGAAPHSLRRRVVALAVAGGATGVILLSFPLMARRLLGLTPLASSTIDDRLAIYRSALELAGTHLYSGVGASGFIDAIPAVLDADWYLAVGADTTLDSPHNWVMQALLSGGVPLVLLALALACASAVVGFRRWQSAARARASARMTDVAQLGRKPKWPQTPSDSGEQADLLAGSGLALAGFGVALLTHFTSPGTTIFAALLLGFLLAVPQLTQPRASTTTPRSTGATAVDEAVFARSLGRARPVLVRFRPFVLGIWAIALVLATAGEVPLATGVKLASSAQVAEADASFAMALTLRPWDADASSIAAQVMAQEADAQVPGAAALAVAYARRSLSAAPDSVLTAKALAVGQQYSGDLEGARVTLDELSARVPYDASVALRHGGISVLLGDYEAAESQLLAATKLAPTDASPWQTLEYLYQQTGDAEAEAQARDRIDTLDAGE